MSDVMDSKNNAGKLTEETSNASGQDSKKFVSRGYRIHNEITYRGVDWLLNSSVGVAMTYWAERTTSGEKYFGKPLTKLFDTLLKPFMKDDAARLARSAWGKRFASIMAGGFAIIPIMMLLEKKEHKKAIVRHLDKWTHGKDSVANDPKFEEAYRQIDNEPKKDLMTGMVARFIAIAPILAVAVSRRASKQLVKYMYDPIGRVTQKIAATFKIRPIKTPPNATVTIMEAGTPVTKNMLADGELLFPKQGHTPPSTEVLSNWDFLHRTIGFDVGLTVFYAFLHEIVYKTLAGREAKYKAEHPKHGAQPSSTQPAVSVAVQDTSPQTTSNWADKKPSSKPAVEKADSYIAATEQRRSAAATTTQAL